jgi:hypothetical protein
MNSNVAVAYSNLKNYQARFGCRTTRHRHLYLEDQSCPTFEKLRIHFRPFVGLFRFRAAQVAVN